MRAITLVLLTLTLAACSHGVGDVALTEPDRFARLEAGSSDKRDVYYLFGQPHAVREAAPGGSWIYFSGRASMSPWTYVPYVGMAAGGYDYDVRITEIRFDSSDIYQEFVLSNAEAYQNMWGGFVQGGQTRRADLVEAEMNRLELPFDARSATENAGLDRILAGED